MFLQQGHVLGPGTYELRKTQSAHATITDIIKASFSFL